MTRGLLSDSYLTPSAWVQGVATMSGGRILAALSLFVASSLLIAGSLTIASIGDVENRPGVVSTEAARNPKRGGSGRMTLPAGMTFRGELLQAMRSDQSAPNQEFWLGVNQPVIIGGVTAVPAGSRIRRQVTAVETSGGAKRRARLTLAFRQIETAFGPYPIIAEPMTREATPALGNSSGRVEFVTQETLRVRLAEPVTIMSHH